MRPTLAVFITCAAAACTSDDAAADRRTVPLPAVSAAAAPAASDLPTLSASDADPYFDSEVGRKARDAFALERWDDAEKGFAELVKTTRDDAERVRATLMLGLAQTLQEEWKPAIANLEKVLPELPLLSDYVHYQLARALYFAHDGDQALAHARKVSADSIVGASAELLAGDILRGRGNPAAVRDCYAAYLKARPDGIRLSEAKYREADAISDLVTGGAVEVTALGRALTLWRDIAVGDPLSKWAEDARKRIDAIAAHPPAGLPDAVLARARAPLSADEEITTGFVYYNAMRNPESEAHFAAALTAAGLDDDERCVAEYYRANSVFKARDRKRAAPLFDSALAACKKTKNADLQVKAAYQAGRSYASTGDAETALARYAEVESMHPEHSYADDARLRRAEAYRDLGNDTQVTQLLASIPKLYPAGDMRAEAMWRLAWRAFKDKDYDQAIYWLGREIEVMPVDNNFWAQGQAQYWTARALAEKGKAAEAKTWYLEVIDTYPMTYYSLLALNRLRETYPDDFKKTLARITPTPLSSAPPMSFKPRKLYGTPGFERALEFLRLGLGTRAEAELRKLGMTTPPGKDPVTDPDTVDKLWAMAYLYHRAHRYESSHWVTRWHVLDYKRHWPRGSWRLNWQIAYPHAWWPLLEKWAKKRGYPTELQIAFVREESAFNPLRESFANAIGLTQLIFPTARRFSEGTGIQVSRDTLRDPEKNVTIGSNFLSFLMSKFDDRPALVVPSYNAGENATLRWLKERGDWKQDEWGEEIPYDETRNYTKRVLASYFAYSFLNDGTVPEMPNTIPKSLLP